MTKAADISTKKLISLAPNNWVTWVTQLSDVVAGEILSSDFQWIVLLLTHIKLNQRGV
jgi:predicted transposase YdaD